jgi:hypothetical protein
VTVANGGSASCTVTNDDAAATLTVTKLVTNDNGGTKVASDFPLFVDGGSVTSGVATSVNAGTHTVTETQQSGYTGPVFGGDCDASGNVTVANGGSASCTVTNDDAAATLTVTKVVINDNGGTKSCADFSFSVDGGAAVAFEADCSNSVTVNAGSHSVTEPAVAGYTTTYNNCTNVAVANGGSATCTITNNDNAPTVVSQITPTATTCQSFSAGTSATLGQLNYSVKNGKISQVDPGVFFYWVKVSGGGSYTITQNITSGNFSTKFNLAAGSAVFNANCVKVNQASITQNADGSVTVTFSGTGTFYIGIKYDTGSVKNQTAPNPSTVHYEFSTTGVAGSTNGLDLKLK